MGLKFNPTTGQLDLVGSGGSYTLPTASASVLGGIKVGTGLSIDGSSVLSATGSGTPGGSDTQVQFNDEGSFGGDSKFTYDKSNSIITLGETFGSFYIKGISGISEGGSALSISAGDSDSGGDGSNLRLSGGNCTGTGSGTGGNVEIYAGSSFSGGVGGYIELSGNDIKLKPKTKKIYLIDGSTFVNTILDYSSIATSDKTFTFPNRSLTLDNITTSTTTNGTGFLKGNGTVISFDNSTYLTSLSGALLATGATTGATSQTQVFTNTLQISALTASKVVFTDASKNLTSTGIGTSSQFIKGDGSLDSSTYLTSLSGAVLTNQSTPQTIGATGARLAKLWATDITCTNAIAGSVTGNAGTVTNATLTTALTVNTGTVTLTGNVANTSVLTIGAGAVSVSGSNTGDETTSRINTLYGTANAFTCGTIELGAASDTTISRSSAGVIAVEGTAIPKGTGTSNLIAYWSGTNTVAGLATATYPSLTELSYVKGVTSAIQTQLGTKVTSGGALGTPSSGTLTNCTGLPVAGITSSTSTALGVGTLELGAASDTTLSRVSAGVIAVEGVTVPTISSTNTLTNKTYQLTAAPSTDVTVSGTTIQLVANENQAFGDACYIDSDGEAHLGDADAIATSSCILLCTGTVTTGNTGTYLLMGIARNDAWTWTVGGLIYLSTTGTTGNTLTQTAPSGTDDVVQILGVATHADRMIFNPQLVQIERT